jgi:hypothetical protein
MKLMCRCVVPARSANSSWLTRWRSRQPRNEEAKVVGANVLTQ